jgi:N-acylglucosamine 2-epimerase
VDGGDAVVTFDRDSLADFYRAQIVEDFLPFWMRAIDLRNGGVFTGYDNAGTTLVSTDKYTWSQGRFAWILARLAEMCRSGLLPADSDELLVQAGRTVGFLLDHAFLPNGNCAFVLSADGTPKEPAPGSGFDTSVSADCFVVMGLSEFARVTADPRTAEAALSAFDGICARIESGNYRTEPYPFPDGYAAFSVPMLMLNVAQEVARCLETLGHSRAREVEGRAAGLAHHLLDRFVGPSGLVAELLPQDGAGESTLLARHVNPGHAIECMWFVLAQAQRMGDESLARRAVETIRASIAVGWDESHGGLLRFVDREGGRPTGGRIGGRYEALVTDTWDLKLWWPHSEALYATLLAWSQHGDPELLAWYERFHRYSFDTFPNADRGVGEWVQIRDRRGSPVERVVALPVKDPYHILRNMMLIVELLHTNDSPLRISVREEDS